MSWTPTDDSDLVDRLADVLLRRRGYTLDARPGDDFLVQADGDQIDGARHDARAVLVAVGPTIAAQALRDAAHMLDTSWAGIRQKASPGWLRNQADIIEKEAGR